MIKNPHLLKQFDRAKLDYKSALKLFESMWKEALSLKVLPAKNKLEGIEVDFRIAKLLNSCLKNS